MELPVLPTTTDRTEFGFRRTVCACRLCQINCEHVPGFLVPQDLWRIANHLGYNDLWQFAEEHLCVSYGTKIRLANEAGEKIIVTIPTVVPDRNAQGHCKFLVEGRCSIHAVSPFGCSAFDAHMSNEEAARRSKAGILAVAESLASNEEYAHVCDHLRVLGRHSVPLALARMSLIVALKQEGLLLPGEELL